MPRWLVAPTAAVLDIPGLVWSAGAPVLLATERSTGFAFETPDGDGATAHFARCVVVTFGFPNDETQHGHRLWSAGLRHYSVNEIFGSPWIEQLRNVERVHDRAPAVPFPHARHFVLTFEDSILEAIAENLVAGPIYDSMAAAIASLPKPR
jgi:hypothetical protein